MKSLGEGLELEHIAYHRDLARSRRIGQDAQSRFHRLRICIVSVVVKDDTVLQFLDVHTHACRLEVRYAVRDLLIRQAKILSYCSSCHRRVDHVPAQARDLDNKCARRSLRLAAHFVGKRVLDIDCSVIAAFGLSRPVESKAAGVDPGIHLIKLTGAGISHSVRARFQGREQRVVAVQNSCAALFKAVEDLAFSSEDVLSAA